MERFQRVIRRTESAFNFVGLGLLFLLMFLVTADVTGRRFLNMPIMGTMDITEVVLCIMIFFGMAYTQSRGANPNIDIVVLRLPPRIQNIVWIFNYFLGMAVFAMLAGYQGLDAFNWWRAGRESQLLHIPLYLLKFAIALGFALLSLELLLQGLKKAMGYKGGKE